MAQAHTALLLAHEDWLIAEPLDLIRARSARLARAVSGQDKIAGWLARLGDCAVGQRLDRQRLSARWVAPTQECRYARKGDAHGAPGDVAAPLGGRMRAPLIVATAALRLQTWLRDP